MEKHQERPGQSILRHERRMCPKPAEDKVHGEAVTKEQEWPVQTICKNAGEQNLRRNDENGCVPNKQPQRSLRLHLE
jgi:hypothetical protein